MIAIDIGSVCRRMRSLQKPPCRQPALPALCAAMLSIKHCKKCPFIESVKSDIKNSAFNIVFKQGEDVEIDELRKAVEDAGFSVGSLKITGNFQDLKIENDTHVEIGKEVFHFLNVSEQVLNGEQTISVVDKNFVTAKQFKKFSSASKMSCVLTGKAGSCCAKEGIAPDARVYHVTI